MRKIALPKRRGDGGRKAIVVRVSIIVDQGKKNHGLGRKKASAGAEAWPMMTQAPKKSNRFLFSSEFFKASGKGGNRADQANVEPSIGQRARMGGSKIALVKCPKKEHPMPQPMSAAQKEPKLYAQNEPSETDEPVSGRGGASQVRPSKPFNWKGG